ncbi:MAG: hypothetical protein FD138_4703, partial [Planctomycetota bacterium]
MTMKVQPSLMSRRVWALILAACVLVAGESAWAQTSAKSKVKKAESVAPAGPKEFRSANFLVHTDLPADEAQDLLKRLETMLTLISKYWGKPNKQTIE